MQKKHNKVKKKVQIKWSLGLFLYCFFFLQNIIIMIIDPKEYRAFYQLKYRSRAVLVLSSYNIFQFFFHRFFALVLIWLFRYFSFKFFFIVCSFLKQQLSFLIIISVKFDLIFYNEIKYNKKKIKKYQRAIAFFIYF